MWLDVCCSVNGHRLGTTTLMLLIVAAILLIIAIAGGVIIHPIIFALAIVAIAVYFSGRRGAAL
jgi:hypothetical protein